MAPSHGSKATFLMGTVGTPATLVDVSTYTKTAGLPFQRDKAETSTLHATTKSYVAGLKDAAIPFEGPFDGAIDAQLFAMVNGGNVNFEYYPQGNTTGLAKYAGQVTCTKYEMKSDVSDAASFSAELQVVGEVTRTLVP